MPVDVWGAAPAIGYGPRRNRPRRVRPGPVTDALVLLGLDPTRHWTWAEARAELRCRELRGEELGAYAALRQYLL